MKQTKNKQFTNCPPLFPPSSLQKLPQVVGHALVPQLLQAVVAVDDGVGGHHHHPEAVGVLAQLAPDGRAHDHVQAVVAAAGVSVIVAGEHGFHPCGATRQVSDAEDKAA